MTDAANKNNYEKNGNFEETHSHSWSDYVRILRRRWWQIVICLILVMAPTTYITLKTKPVYQASTTIMVEEDRSMQKVLFKQGGFGQRNNIFDQIYLIKSRAIAELVIERLLKSEIKDSLQILDYSFAQSVAILRGSLTASTAANTWKFISLSAKGSSHWKQPH